MEPTYEGLIESIRSRDAEASRHEHDADAIRWRMAEEIAEACKLKSQRQVAEDTGLSKTTVVRYSRVWAQFGGPTGTDRPVFNKAMTEVRGDTRSEQGFQAEINKRTPEQKAELIKELAADPAVARALPSAPPGVSSTARLMQEPPQPREERPAPAPKPVFRSETEAPRPKLSQEKIEEWRRMERQASEAPVHRTALDWGQANGALEVALKKIEEAIPFIADHGYEGEEHDLLSEILGNIIDRAEHARAVLDPSTDWDAELQRETGR